VSTIKCNKEANSSKLEDIKGALDRVDEKQASSMRARFCTKRDSVTDYFVPVIQKREVTDCELKETDLH